MVNIIVNLIKIKIIIIIACVFAICKAFAMPDFLEQSNDILESNYSNDTYFFIYEKSDVAVVHKIYDSLSAAHFDYAPAAFNKFPRIVLKKLNSDDIDSVIINLRFKERIISVTFEDCKIERIPSSLNQLKNLESIIFYKCDSLKSFGDFNSNKTTFAMFFVNCNISRLPKNIENFKPLLKLWLRFNDDFQMMDLDSELSRFIKRNNVLSLYVRYNRLNSFPSSIMELNSLWHLVFQSNSNISYPQSYEKLPNIRSIIITDDKQKVKEDFLKNPLLETYLTFEFINDSTCIQQSKFDDPFYNICSLNADGEKKYFSFESNSISNSLLIDNIIQNYNKTTWDLRRSRLARGIPLVRNSKHLMDYYNNDSSFIRNVGELNYNIRMDTIANTIKLIFNKKPDVEIQVELKDKSDAFYYAKFKTKEQVLLIEFDKYFLKYDYFITIILNYKGEKSFLTII